MTLARYPNTGYMRIADVFDANGIAASGRRQYRRGPVRLRRPAPARWAGKRDLAARLLGLGLGRPAAPAGSVDGAARTISLGSGPGRSYDIRKGQWFYAENVLPELDSPGEWYLDRDAGILYFWPPAPLATGQDRRLRRPRPDPPQRRFACHLPRPVDRSRTRQRLRCPRRFQRARRRLARSATWATGP